MTSMEAAASLFGSSDSSSDFFATPEGGNSTSESPAGTKKDDDIFTDGNAGELFADAGKDAVASDLFSGAEESFLGTQDIYGTGITEQSTSQNNVYEHGDQSHVTAGQATYDYNEGDYDPYSEGWYDEHNQWHPYEEAAVTASTTVNTAADPYTPKAPATTYASTTQQSQSQYAYYPTSSYGVQQTPSTPLYGAQPSSPYVPPTTSYQSTYDPYAPTTTSASHLSQATSYETVSGSGSSAYSPYGSSLSNSQTTSYSVPPVSSPYTPYEPLAPDSRASTFQAPVVPSSQPSLIPPPPPPANTQPPKTPTAPYRPATSNAYDPPLPSKKPRKPTTTSVVQSPASPFVTNTISPPPPLPPPARSSLSPPTGNATLPPGPPPRSSTVKTSMNDYAPSPYSQPPTSIPRASSPYDPPSSFIQHQSQINTYPSQSSYVPHNAPQTDVYSPPPSAPLTHSDTIVNNVANHYEEHSTPAESPETWVNPSQTSPNGRRSLEQIEEDYTEEIHNKFETLNLGETGSEVSPAGHDSFGQHAMSSRPSSPYIPSSPPKAQKIALPDSRARMSPDIPPRSGVSHRSSSPLSDSGRSQTGSTGRRTHSRKSSSQATQSFSALDEQTGKQNDPYGYVPRTSLERVGSPGSAFGVPPPSLTANSYAAQDQNVVDLTRDTPSPIMPRTLTLESTKSPEAPSLDPYKPTSAPMVPSESSIISPSNTYSPSHQYAPPRSSLDKTLPPRERSMSSLSTYSSVSAPAYNPYAPPSHAPKRHDLPPFSEESYEANQPSSGYGSYVNGNGRSSFESTYSAPPMSGPYAPSPSLLGTNDPLGRASAKVPVISFGFGGKLITCFHSPPVLSTGFDVALSSRKCTDVQIRPLHKLIPESAVDSSLATYPGPLFGDPGTPVTTLVRTTTSSNTKIKNKKSKVLTYLEERINEIERALGYLTAGSVEKRQAEGKLVLVRLLRTLVEHDGQLHGNASAEAAVRAAVLPRLGDSQNESDTNVYLNAPTGAALASGSFSASHSNETPLEEYAVRPSSLKTLQDFLLRGEKRKAYHYALDEKLWAHAMVISSSLDKDAFKEVVSEFIRTELGVKTGSRSDAHCTNGWESLRLAYSLYSGQASTAVQHLFPIKSLQAGPSLTLQPPTPMNHMTPLSPNFPNPSQATNIPPDILSQWQEYAVMLFSGQMGAESSSALTTLGDYLLSNDWVEAAHCCYLMSPQTSPIGGVGVPSVRIVLVGSHSPHRNSSFFLDPDNFIFSEILEFALSLHTPAKGQEAFPGFPHLQVYRLMRALQLAEMGHIQLAKRYCESITSAAARPSPYLSPLFSDYLKELYNRINGDPELDKAGSWIGGKIAKPSLDGLGDWIGGTLSKFVAGDTEPSSPRGEHPLANNPAYSGTFSHFSNISSANTSRVSSPAPSFTNGNVMSGIPGVPPARSGSAMAMRPTAMSQIPMNRAASAMGYDRFEAKAEHGVPRVFSADAGTTTFSQSQSFPSSYNYMGMNNNNHTGNEDVTQKGEPQDQQGSGWWSSAYGNGPTPTASSFVKVDTPVTDSGSGFISLMDTYSPFTPSPALSAAPSQRNGIAEEPENDDDLGLGNSSKKMTPVNTPEVGSEVEKREEKKIEPAKPAEAKPAASSSWLGRWFSRSSTPGPTKANLGEETAFYYDKELKRWVNKKAGAEPPKPALPPPPPSRAQTASPSRAMQISTTSLPPPSPLPPRRPLSAMDTSSGPPPSRPIQRSRSSLIPEESAGSLDPTPSVMAPLTVPPPTGRPKSAAKKSVRNRYVDVFQQPPS